MVNAARRSEAASAGFTSRNGSSSGKAASLDAIKGVSQTLTASGASLIARPITAFDNRFPSCWFLPDDAPTSATSGSAVMPLEQPTCPRCHDHLSIRTEHVVSGRRAALSHYCGLCEHEWSIESLPPEGRERRLARFEGIPHRSVTASLLPMGRRKEKTG